MTIAAILDWERSMLVHFKAEISKKFSSKLYSQAISIISTSERTQTRKERSSMKLRRKKEKNREY